jgi:hypothetical protein
MLRDNFQCLTEAFGARAAVAKRGASMSRIKEYHDTKIKDLANLLSVLKICVIALKSYKSAAVRSDIYRS